MKLEKKLAAGELRFVGKVFDAKQKLWGVYDKARGSWPHTSPELGDVKQRLKLESEAAEEAERLNGVERIDGKKQSGAAQTVQVAIEEDLASPAELPDYGVMSEAERKKYEEGLF